MEPRASDSSPPGRPVASRLTAIFSKRPAPGRAKTRLSPPLSPRQAAELAEGMLRDVVERCLACDGFRTALAFTPAADEPWFRRSFPALEDLRPQLGPDLAARLAAFFGAALAEVGTGSVLAVGSDQPLVPASRMVDAHEHLERGADLVLGPDLGGGYYLIGMRRPQPRLFTEVRMSTAGMFERTLDLARRAGLEVALLPASPDVDVEADLLRIRSELLGAAGAPRRPDFPRHTARLLGELFPVGGRA